MQYQDNETVTLSLKRYEELKNSEARSNATSIQRSLMLEAATKKLSELGYCIVMNDCYNTVFSLKKNMKKIINESNSIHINPIHP